MRFCNLLLIAAGPPILTIILLAIFAANEGVTPIPVDAPPGKNAHDLAKFGLGFIDTLDAFLLAGLGGVAAFIYKIMERKIRLGNLGVVLAALAIGLFVSGLIAGYNARVSGLRALTDSDIFLIDQGGFHVASTIQAAALLIGVSTFGVLILALIQPPIRSHEKEESDENED